MFIDYILTVHKNDLFRILEDTGIHNSYSVNIDFLNLFENYPNIGDSVLCNPKHYITKCDNDLIEAQKRLLENIEDAANNFIIKQNVFARFYSLPVCPELHRNIIPKNKDLGCFLKLTGTAVRVTQARMLEHRRSYKCVKCQHTQVVEGIYEQRYLIKAPTKCRNPDMNCRCHTFTPINQVTRENCKDYQELKIQEQVNKLTVGGIPGSIWVTLEDDLVDKCKPGDDVSICGTVLRRWNPVANNKKCEVELVFKANHLKVCNAQKAVAISVDPDVIKEFNEFWESHKACPMKGRDVILASVCPKVYGLYMVKLALTLTVITGSSHNLDDLLSKNNKHDCTLSEEERDRSVRGQCHLLLVGDPGTGKSQLLKAGSTMLSRSVITSGSGSTKAGLTCTALREEGEWQLEAGALVLADGGACFIDELAQMREHDRASIHEAMEQQTISVAKAGIICKLNTRCAVIAACNPKGNYDTEQPLSVNVSLGTPLLSRFDLIFILLDTQNCEWDNLVSDYVLFGTTTKALPKGWSLEKLQLYMSLIGPFEVRITKEANTILGAYYVRQRNVANRDPSRTTVRMLDSLVRLTQAHAKLMYRHETLAVDAIVAVSLVDLSMQDCTLSDTSDALHTSFSFYPDLEYLKTAQKILSSLNLYELWHDELDRYANVLNVNRQVLENAVEKNITKYFVKNVMIDESVVQSQETVVESSFFHNSKDETNLQDKSLTGSDLEDKTKDNKVDVNKQANIFSNNKSDDDADIDAILNLNTTNNVNKTVIEKDNKDTILAQTLRKHSNMYKRNNMAGIGIVTVKRKREKCNNTNKNNKKAKASKKSSDNDLQSVLNELNRGQNKKGTKKVAQKKKVAIKPNLMSDNSSSDDDVDETKILNCLPSVNDDFSVMRCESDEDIFVATQLSQDACQVKYDILDAKVDTKDIEGETSNIIDITIPRVMSPENKNGIEDNCKPLISPININAFNKLKQFAFVKSATKKDKPSIDDSVQQSTSKKFLNFDECGGDKEDRRINCEINKSLEILTHDNASIQAPKNNTHGETSRSDIKNAFDNETIFKKPNTSFVSQKSIFEDDNEDYNNLEL